MCIMCVFPQEVSPADNLRAKLLEDCYGIDSESICDAVIGVVDALLDDFNLYEFNDKCRSELIKGLSKNLDVWKERYKIGEEEVK